MQALFDRRVGDASLDPLMALYTNIVDEPDPQPIAMASDLMALGNRAILIIDNCTPELHRRLSDLCRSSASRLSVITVEYDIREDEPEGTDVFKLKPSSISLTENLISRRFPGISAVDVGTIAKFSGGNARVAISLAGTVGKNDTVAGLDDEELFQRLFHQRQQPNETLFLAAQALSLVYSFQGEDISDGDQGELEKLGALIGLNAQALFRAAAELLNRDLVQRRGVWRAVLPHAIANRLARKGLQNIPFSDIHKQLIAGGNTRLFRSFSRRLGYLDDSSEARGIVSAWLAPRGLLGNIAELNDLGFAVFENVAPVDPESVLGALERAISGLSDEDVVNKCARYVRLLRSVAYDASMFDRAVALILRIAEAGDVREGSTAAVKAFSSLCFIWYSGTWATIEQRLNLIETLLRSGSEKRRALGAAGLKGALEAWSFLPFDDFEFGSHSRDYGSAPRNPAEVRHWFGSALALCNALGCADLPCAPSVRAVLAEQFRGLWTRAGVPDEIEAVCRAIRNVLFWREGWLAVRRTQHGDPQGSDVHAGRLASLESLLRPANLPQSVRSLVFSRHGDVYLEDLGNGHTDDPGAAFQRGEERIRDLGSAVATDPVAFDDLLPELVSERGRLWPFGRGLADGAADASAIWARIVKQLGVTPGDKQDVEVLRGFLSSLNEKDPALTRDLLDASIQDDIIGPWFPALQSAIAIDALGALRIKRALMLGKAPIARYRHLAWHGAPDSASDADLRELILEISTQLGGFDIAVEILHMRLHADDNGKHPHSTEIINAGRLLIGRISFVNRNDDGDFHLSTVIESCLCGPEGAVIAQQICCSLKTSVANRETSAYDHDDLLESLFRVQPSATLDGLCGDDGSLKSVGAGIIDQVRRTKRKNLLALVPAQDLIDWCDRDAAERYPTVAANITIAEADSNTSPPHFSKCALRLLDKAPDRVEVLRQLIRQFRPSGWSGSLAAIIEANAKLLDELDTYPDPAVVEFLAQEKVRLRQAIDHERELEDVTNRQDSERFE